MTAFEERPHSPYYGCADATPLYVVLLDEYERWTGDRKLVRDLEHEARAALTWIDEYADLLGQRLHLVPAPQREDRPREPVLEGLLGLDLLPRRPAARLPAGDLRAAGLRLRREAARRPPRAPRLEGPRVRRRARAARPPTSSGVSTATSGSRTASTSPSRSTPRASRSTRSPRTTATCSGAASSTSRRRRPSPRHLMGPRLFSGWGVRTLAEGEARYNPIGYHVGTVWPFDNSFIAWGLRRYGFKEEAARDRRRHPRRGRVLRRAPARGVRRLRARADEVSRPVPDGVQPAGVVDRHAAAAAADDARPRARGRAPRRSTRRCRRRSAAWSCSTSPAAGAASTRSAAAESTSTAAGVQRDEHEAGRRTR